MAAPLRHRQTKGAETDMPSLPPPRHIPTLPEPTPGMGTKHQICFTSLAKESQTGDPGRDSSRCHTWLASARFFARA